MANDIQYIGTNDPYATVNSLYSSDNPYMSNDPYMDVIDVGQTNIFNEGKYRSASAQYQADLNKYMIQHYDQLRMIANQRAYDSPLAQRARMLAAGFNPDLAGSNTDVGSGASSSVPAIGASSMPDVKSVPETVLDIASGIASFAGGLSSLFSGVGAAVSVAGNIASFKDRMDSLHSSSVSSEAQSMRDRISLYGDLASGMNPQVGSDGKLVIPDISTVKEYCATLGIAEDTGISEGLHAYLQNPKQQKIYEDSILALRRSAADRLAHPFDFVRQVADNNSTYELASSQVSAIKANFSKIFSSEYLTEDNAQTLAGAQSTQLRTDAKTADFRATQLEQDIAAFEDRLSFLQTMRDKISKSKSFALNKIVEEGANSSWLQYYESLCISDAQFAGLSSDMLNYVYALANNLKIKEYTAGISIGDDGTLNMGNRVLGSTFYNFIGTMFDSPIGAQSQEGVNAALGTGVSIANPALSVVWDYLRSQVGAGPSTTVNNNTSNFGPHHTIINK